VEFRNLEDYQNALPHFGRKMGSGELLGTAEGACIPIRGVGVAIY